MLEYLWKSQRESSIITVLMGNDRLSYKKIDTRYFIKAEGHISARLCPELRSVILDQFDTNSPPSEILIDLANCDYMDSTFLGLIAALSRKLQGLHNQLVKVSGATDECNKLFQTLGMEHLVTPSETPEDRSTNWIELSTDQKATEDLLFKAHSELSSLNDENKKKFTALLELLKNKPK